MVEKYANNKPVWCYVSCYVTFSVNLFRSDLCATFSVTYIVTCFVIFSLRNIFCYILCNICCENPFLKVRPVRNQSDSVTVKFKLKLSQLIDVVSQSLKFLNFKSILLIPQPESKPALMFDSDPSANPRTSKLEI